MSNSDWYGVTIDGWVAPISPLNMRRLPVSRLEDLFEAHERGIKTWISYEPVVNSDAVLGSIRVVAPYTDKVKIGKLNYWPSDINWAQFGRAAEKLCREMGLDYYSKDGLRAEMNKA